MGTLRDFKLEVYFGRHEFSAPHLLAQSDCESMTVSELLEFEPEAEQRLKDAWLGYTEVPGDPELRDLVASLYTTMDGDDVLVHTGAQEAVFAYMSVLLEPGDHVISMYPTYQSLYEVALSQGCEVSRWSLMDMGNGWTLDFDELRGLLRPNTKLIVVNTPNNPTGYTLNEEEIRELCRIASGQGINIFADEVYKGLDLDGARRPWVADVYDRATSLGVMSKAYGLAGLRIGWVASKDAALLDRQLRFKHYMSICNSAPSECLAVIALKQGDRLLERNREIIRGNLALADAFFKRCGGLFADHPPQCGPVAFHRMNKEVDMGEFCEELVRKSGVLLLPSTAYEYPGPYFRMGYGRRNFAESLRVFEEHLTEQGLVQRG
ncbi:MAG: aminotransferase class I/II-fold pyridoxal phosphate-dependent enzyme [Coriobacteriales bacterium]|jgi:aspartate/methionine/tyrosine aminotransferase|nr:aminotransferase class I/II-fold pyridoxal phosphate-dependent enzyme [Coriobacteriales bacterium]